MTVFSITLGRMIALFLIVIAGYIVKRCGLVKEEWVGGLMKLLMNFFLPVVIFNALQIDVSPDMIRNSLYFCIAIAIWGTAALGYGFLTAKICRIRDGALKGSWVSCVWIPNVAFIGVPLVQTLFPDSAMLYTAMALLIFGVLTFTTGLYGLVYCTRQKGSKISPKLLINVNNAAVLLGAITLIFDIDLPTSVLSATGMISSATTPLAMLAVGILMTRIPFKSLFDDWRIYVLIVLKQLVCPVLTFLIARPFSPEPLFLSVLVLFSAMPVPAPPLSLISNYGGNLLWATRTVVMTTLLSVITIPLVAYWFL